MSCQRHEGLSETYFVVVAYDVFNKWSVDCFTRKDAYQHVLIMNPPPSLQTLGTRNCEVKIAAIS